MKDELPDLSQLVSLAIMSWDENRERTQQARAGKIGPSNIGFCRQQAVLITNGVQPSDSAYSWSAVVGTALHVVVGEALQQTFPDWLVDTPAKPNPRVTATLPRTAAEVSGTPDVIIPKRGVYDLKSKDGLEQVKHYGTTQNHKMQRHLYGMGCIAAGIFKADEPFMVGCIYIDRSGKDPVPYVEEEPFDPAFTEEIDSWIEDVIYAVLHGEEGSRDIAAARCETFCEFFTACRGSLPMQESEPITDAEAIQAIDMYVEGREMEKVGKRLKSEASALLHGINGSDGRFQVRWTHINETEVPGFTRRASDRIDVRKLKAPKK